MGRTCIAACACVSMMGGSFLEACAADNTTKERSEKIRQQIEHLLANRRGAKPLPLDPPNPFEIQAPVLLNTPRAADPAPLNNAIPPPDPATTLARFASELRISGMIRLNDQVQIIVNDNAWKEGDFLTIERAGRVVRLQVAKIMPGQLTLRLDEAELVIRF